MECISRHYLGYLGSRWSVSPVITWVLGGVYLLALSGLSGFWMECISCHYLGYLGSGWSVSPVITWVIWVLGGVYLLSLSGLSGSSVSPVITWVIWVMGGMYLLSLPELSGFWVDCVRRGNGGKLMESMVGKDLPLPAWTLDGEYPWVTVDYMCHPSIHAWSKYSIWLQWITPQAMLLQYWIYLVAVDHTSGNVASILNIEQTFLLSYSISSTMIVTN